MKSTGKVRPFSATQAFAPERLFLPPKRSLVETLPSTPEQRDKGGNEESPQ
jgi:hypothetical protein